jgi:hypothetical protein
MGNSLPGNEIGVGVSGIRTGMTSCETLGIRGRCLSWREGNCGSRPFRPLIGATLPSLEARRDANPDTKPADEVGHCTR